MGLNTKLLFWFFSAFFGLALVVRSDLFPGPNWENILISDAEGYIAYWRLALVDHRLFDKTFHFFINETADGFVFKYTSGTAMLMTPFVLLMALVSWLIEGEIVYAFYFPMAAQLSASFYGALLLVNLHRIALHLRIEKTARILWLIATLFGTALINFIIFAPGMAHVYVAAMLSGFVLHSLRFSDRLEPKELRWLGIYLAIATLVRPVDAIAAIFLPFALAWSGQLKNFVKKILWRDYLFAVLPAGLILSVQLIITKFTSGSFFTWNYQGEGFYFDSPDFFSVLFSTEVGLFIYTPIAALSVVALIFMLKSERFLALGILAVLCLATYVFASWWCWTFMDFGSRPYIDLIVFLMLPIAFLLNEKGKALRTFVTVLIVLLTLSQIKYQYQYVVGIVDHYFMNGNKYKYIFWTLNRDSNYELGGWQDAEPYPRSDQRLLVESLADFDQPLDAYWKTPERNVGRWSGLESGACAIPPRSTDFQFSFSDPSMKNDSIIVCKAEFDFYDPRPNASVGARLVVRSLVGADQYWEDSRLMNDVPETDSMQWRRLSFCFYFPKRRGPNSIIQIYIEHTGKDTFYLDNAHIRLFATPL